MAISTRNIKPRSIIPELIKGVKFVQDLCMLGGAVLEVAADVVAAPTLPKTTVKLVDEHLAHLDSAKFISHYEWAATADGYIELYDVTEAKVLAKTSLLVGGETETWDVADVTEQLKAGNQLRVRVNVTVAGATGEVVKIYRAYLRLICKIG